MEKRIIVPGEELEGNVSDYFYEEKGKSIPWSMDFYTRMLISQR